MQSLQPYQRRYFATILYTNALIMDGYLGTGRKTSLYRRGGSCGMADDLWDEASVSLGLDQVN